MPGDRPGSVGGARVRCVCLGVAMGAGFVISASARRMSSRRVTEAGLRLYCAIGSGGGGSAIAMEVSGMGAERMLSTRMRTRFSSAVSLALSVGALVS